MWHDLFPKGHEAWLAVLGAWFGALWSIALEGVAPLVYWFLTFVTADLITGIWAGIKNEGFSSSRLYFGMMKKGVAFAIVILARGLDVNFSWLYHDIPLFQSMTLAAYACGEFGSIVENLSRMGYGDALPPILRRIFLTLEKRIETAVDKKLDGLGLEDKDEQKKTPQ